jgi:hypothetical protein
VIEIDEDVLGPELIAELVAGHDLAGLREQQLQNPERLVLQPDLEAMFAQFAGARIELVRAEPHGRTSRGTSGSHSRDAVVVPHNGLPVKGGRMLTVIG